MFFSKWLINSLHVSLEVVRMAQFMSGRCHRGALLYLCPTFWTAPWARIKALMSRSVWVCSPGSTNISKLCHNKIYSSVPFIWFWQVVPLVSAHVYQLVLFLSTAGECKVCVCTSRHITAVKSLSFCSSGLALVSGGIGGLLNIWSLQVSTHHSLLLPLPSQQYQSIKLFLCVT